MWRNSSEVEICLIFSLVQKYILKITWVLPGNELKEKEYIITVIKKDILLSLDIYNESGSLINSLFQAYTPSASSVKLSSLSLYTGDEIENYILLLSSEKYYQDEVVKYGYCRGTEPYNFVYDILDRYSHYKNVIED